MLAATMPKASPARPVTKAATNVPPRNIASSNDRMSAMLICPDARIFGLKGAQTRCAARTSAVRLVDCVPAPAIEGVVKPHRGLELGEIIPVHARISERRGQQAGRMGRKVEPSGIRSAHNEDQSIQSVRV